ncbi:hypothetical protein [Amycolatopsis marina]|uniref:hypothetical protein n=1 Tax=Amycolatopsis marina TaxID=490629 RepID=UPI0011602C53|nr:hypothetical protein [Amycolatopsis marina]
MAAIIAIVAAVISAGSTGVAIWQAKLAKRSADVAEADLAESRRQTKAAEQAAVAAEEQVAEARHQNEITEQQLHLAQEELEAGRQRHKQTQVAKQVATVHEVLLAADALREELRDDATAVIEHQNRVDGPFGIGPQLLMFGRAETQWDTVVNKIRVDKPPAPEVTAAIDTYDKFAKTAVKAIEDSRDKAEERRLSKSAAETLVVLVNRQDDEYESLKRACDEFFAFNRVDPSDLTAS